MNRKSTLLIILFGIPLFTALPNQISANPLHIPTDVINGIGAGVAAGGIISAGGIAASIYYDRVYLEKQCTDSLKAAQQILQVPPKNREELIKLKEMSLVLEKCMAQHKPKRAMIYGEVQDAIEGLDDLATKKLPYFLCGYQSS
jgi:hypothetical protein